MVDRLQCLIDEADIRNVHLRYCRGVDRLDWDLVRSCYHPDGTDDHGAFVGGVDDFITWVSAVLAKYESTMHLTGNQLIEVAGDKATAEHYARVFHRRPATSEGPAVDIVANVRYIDKLERRAGEWKIVSRIVVGDSDRIDPVEGAWFGADLKRSTRDRDDPIYQV